MDVPLLDIKAQLAPLREDILKAITEVVDSTRYILGPKVTELEKQMAAYCGVKSVVGVSSGTDALLISLMALDIKPGDVVITTPYSFFATAGVIARLGATPVFVDIDPITYNLAPEQLQKTLDEATAGALTKKAFPLDKVKAIIPVHLYGQSADMLKITALAQRRSIPVVEDAAQAIGVEYPFGETIKKAGSMGHMGCFSFFPSKNLGCMGDGGMVTTNDEALGEKLRTLRTHGGKPKYYHSMIGGNFRLDPMQAAIIMVKYPFLNQWHKARQNNAALYNQLFLEAGLSENGEGIIKTPRRVYQGQIPGLEYDHIFNQYIIRVKERDRVREFLNKKGIGNEVYYPVPFHLQKCFASLGYILGDFPEAERAASRTLALPIYPELTDEQQRYVVDSLKSHLHP